MSDFGILAVNFLQTLPMRTLRVRPDLAGLKLVPMRPFVDWNFLPAIMRTDYSLKIVKTTHSLTGNLPTATHPSTYYCYYSAVAVGAVTRHCTDVPHLPLLNVPLSMLAISTVSDGGEGFALCFAR